MSDNLLNKQIKYVQCLVNLAGQLNDLLNNLQAQANDKNSMGDLTDPLIWQNGEIQHTNATEIDNFVALINTITTWFNTDYKWDVIREVKK